MSVLRLRALVSPQFTCPYLLDVAAVDVASTVLSTTEKLRHQRKRERAVAVDVERMYAEWKAREEHRYEMSR